MNPEQWLSLKWNGGSTMSDRWLNQSKIIQTLKENAIRAHKYLFGTSDYQVSDELSRINQKIIYRAGY